MEKENNKHETQKQPATTDQKEAPEESVIDCNVDNEKLLEAEITRIQGQAWKQGHLSKETLWKRIQQDEALLAGKNITFTQLAQLFEKIFLHYADLSTKQRPLTMAEIELGLKTITYSDLLRQWRLSAEFQKRGKEATFHARDLFGGQLTVVLISWGGAEECPFKSLSDPSYHGYEYGSYDWVFFRNGQCLHVGDLLLRHQITKHHFFQSPTSPFRVDPQALCNFFALVSGRDYSTPTVQMRYFRFLDIVG